MSELQPVLSDAEALDWLRQQGEVKLSQSELATAWGWYLMRVSRRLRQWESEGLILRQHGAITATDTTHIHRSLITGITQSYQRDNSFHNTDNSFNNSGRLEVTKYVCRRSSHLLCGVALTLFATAVSANAAYAWSLGSSDLASAVFAGIGIASDTLVFLLPSVAASQWRVGHKARSLIGWSLYPLALAFALSGSIGFSALNIAEVTAGRAAKTSPAIELAQRRLDVAARQAAMECKAVGPLCRARQAEEREALNELGVARSAVAAGADPQSQMTARLVAWLSPWRPSGDDLALLRLSLLTLIPQLGGLVLLAGRR
jgi:hypothetical protein